jgi:hypothetical protein
VTYETILVSLALDLAVIAVLVFGIYFPRHQRRDLVPAFMGANVGLFAVAAFISEREINLAVGLGLFALLSVVRLRSSEIAQEDIGYYFIALVLGLINGFAPHGDWARTLTLDASLLGVMYVADHPRLLRGRLHQAVTLDAVYTDERLLRADLERQLGGIVTKASVRRVDLVHGHTVVDVAFRPAPPGQGPGTPP